MPEPKEIYEDQQKLLIDYYVQKVSGRLRQLVSPNEKDRKRWIWELLQNAKDSVSHSKNRKVDVVLKVWDDKIIFRHNGAPFTPKALNSLIWQKSGEKRDSSESTGRFGTGFLTTHTLAQNVKLTAGLLESDGQEWTVELTLFRTGESDEALEAGITNTLSSRTWIKERSEWTSFTYFLKSEVNKDSARAGLESLGLNVFYNLAFTPGINSISVIEGNETTVYSRGGNHTTVGKVILTPFVQRKGSVEEIVHITIAHAEYDFYNDVLSQKFKSKRTLRVSAAIAINSLNQSIIPFEKQTPFLFCLFPLIGTEKFYFPVILNSKDFEPTPERDSLLLLGVEDDPESGLITNAGINKLILKEGVDLYKLLLKYVADEKITETHLLAKSAIPEGIGVESKWYQENIQQEIRKEILCTKLVIPAIGKDKIIPSEALFPIHSKDKLKEFWQLCKDIVGTQIPREEDAETWQSIINADKKNWNGLELKFELEDLLLTIQSETTLGNFGETYFAGDESKALDYLSKVIAFTEQENNDLLAEELKLGKIFPNQNGEFDYKDNLSKDLDIPEAIKDIFIPIDDDRRKDLLRTELNEVFISRAELKLKQLSETFKNRVENLLSKRLKEENRPKLVNGLFQLIQLSPGPVTEFHIRLFEFARKVFPERNLDGITPIHNADTFDWNPCFQWAINELLYKLNGWDMNFLSNLLLGKGYPIKSDKNSEDEKEVLDTTDSFIDSLIRFAYSFENDRFHLLEDYAIIPNQENQFCKLNADIFNDVYDKNDYKTCERLEQRIPEELKKWVVDLGSSCRKYLLHSSISFKLKDSRDVSWICGELDSLIMNNQDSNTLQIKQAIREIDRWLQNKIKDEEKREKLFRGFYPKRHRVVYQTFTQEERANLDEIAKSGQSAEIAKLVKAGTEIETLKQIVALSKEMNLNTALSILKKHPQLTEEKIEQLLELEELSKGWNTEVEYNPNDAQIRRNFENGWKGEAFVFKELKRRNFNVEWENKSEVETGDVITDFEGERYFIDDKKSKYDLVVKHVSGKFFIQVKSTTTDIGRADQITLPISTREWKFVHETNQAESYYLARVFNVDTAPELYLMKLETIQELNQTTG